MMNLQQKIFYTFIFINLVLLSTVLGSPPDKPINPWKMRDLMQEGINLGGVFEAPNEGEWSGGSFQDVYASMIFDKGFDHLRLPVKFGNHLGTAPDYTIHSDFIRRIDHVVDTFLKSGLIVILDFHHIAQLDDGDVTAEDKDMFLKVWQQLSLRYKNYTHRLLFELYNEPHGKPEITAEDLNELYAKAITIIRKDNPTRIICAGGRGFNGSYQLRHELVLPWDDGYLMGVAHSYKPMDFTHNNKSTPVEFNTPVAGLEEGLNWAKEFSDMRKIPVYYSEFGAASCNHEEERAKYAAYLKDQLESRGFAWSWWSFGVASENAHCKTFAIYRHSNGDWDELVLKALQLKKNKKLKGKIKN